MPFVAEIVPDIDVDAGRRAVDLPPGLLDLDELDELDEVDADGADESGERVEGA